jgi:hypothetical protein
MASVDDLKTIASTKLGFARPNQFLVNLPQVGGQGPAGFLQNLLPIPSIPSILENAPGGREMNILCSAANLPGKQILTAERRIGIEFQKVAYGYAVEDVSLTFYLMNDYGMKTYFDRWMAKAVQEDAGTVGWKKDYALPVVINQLRKPLKSKSFDAGPITANFDIGGGTVYGVLLRDAFPTTMNAVELNNELDGLVQLTVQISYTKWEKKDGGIAGLVGGNLNLGSIF